LPGLSQDRVAQWLAFPGFVSDFRDHRDVYSDPVNLVPGMPGMRVRKEVNVETITVAGGSRRGPRP
jgi:hypothetical protein